MKKPKLKKYPTGGSKGFIPDKLVHYVGQGETPYTREQLGSMGYNYETTTGGFDEYSMGDNRRFYKTVLPNTPEWSNPENPYLTNTAKPAVAKVGHKTGPYPSYGSPEYIQAHPEYTPPKPRIPTFKHGGMKLPKYLPGGEYESTSMIEDYRAEDGSNFWDGANGQESYYKSQEPVASAADQQQIDNGNNRNNGMWQAATNTALGVSSAYYNNNKARGPQDEYYQQQFEQGKLGYYEMDKSGIDQTLASIPGYGQIYAGAKAASNLGRSAIKKDEYGMANSASAQATDQLMKPMHDQAIDDIKAGNYGDAAGDMLLAGFYKPIKTYLNYDKDKSKVEAAKKDIIEAPLIAEQNRKNNLYHTYAQGGVHSGMPNAELENKEMYNIPGGPISEVNGPSHKQGGVPVSIPNGTEMLPDNSDSLKINTKIVKMFPNLFSKKDIGKTFSDTSRNLKTTKEDKIMKDDKASNMSKSTASLNIEVKKAIYQQKMKALEEFKKSKLQDYAKKLGVTLPQAQEGTEDSMQYSKGGEKGEPYDTLQVLRLTAALSSPLDGSFKKAHDELKAYENKKYLEKNFPGKNAAYQPDKMKNGGTKLPKFDGGMRYIAENLRLAQQAQSGFPTMEEVEDPSFNNALYNKYQTPFIRPSEAERLKNERPNSKQQYIPNPNDPYEQAMAAGKEFEQPAKQVNPKTGNYDWVEPTANTLMQNAGNLAYLAGEGKKYDKQDFYKYNPELYNPADALRQADIEARVNRGKLKDASGGNAGALMSNLTQSQAINTLLKSKIRTDAANQNAGTLNDAQVRNIQGKYNVDDINARNKGQALTNYYNAIRGIGQNTSGAYRDWKRGEVDQQTLDIISKNYPDYVYDKRRKGWYHKSTDKKLE